MTGDQYLWDRGEPVDDDVRRLEQTLEPLRYAPRPLAFPAAARRRWRVGLAAAVVALAAGTLWLLLHGEPGGLRIETVAGPATVDRSPVRGGARLAVGSWLETAAGAAAVVRIADMGTVTVHGDTRLGLLASRAGAEQRLELTRGSIDAFITAPPRLFFVNTRTAVAVDLGCAYQLTIDESGDGLLAVTIGRVALEGDVSTVTVPAGASCRLSADGPGVPWFDDASPAFVAALDRSDIDAVLAAARPRDVLSLWYLLPRVNDSIRPAVVARMNDLAGMPPGVTAEGVARLDPAMLDAWRDDLERDW